MYRQVYQHCIGFHHNHIQELYRIVARVSISLINSGWEIVVTA